MGVYGLWRLLDATGKQVPLETLEGKVLAIDISIWMHQVLQGYQDRFGNPKPNAHLIGLFNRICKLLYYKIKPVFVFDGGVPMLKKDTVALRRKQKSVAKSKAQQMRTELINNLMKHNAVKTVLNTEEQNVTNNSTEVILNMQNKDSTDDIFKLPDMPSTSKAELSLSDDYDSDSSIDLSPRKQSKWIGNIHNVNVASAEFKALPADVRYEILTDLKETRKQNSWGRLHEMPEESNKFSGYQMQRLLKRRLVQQSLESAEKEMGGKTLTLEELDKLLTEQGIDTSGCNCTYRVAADSTTRLVYISDKNAYIKSISSSENSNTESIATNADKVVEPVAGSSKDVPICEDMNEYELDDEWDSDIEITTTSCSNLAAEERSSETESEIELNESPALSKKYYGKNTMNPALTYMLEHSGLTENQILTILEQNREEESKNTKCSLKATQQNRKEESENTKCCLKATQEIEPVEAQDDSKELTEVNYTEAAEPLDNLVIKFPGSNIKTDSSLLRAVNSNISNANERKTEEVTIISSTDSDSDFVEIEDVPTLILDPVVKKNVPRQGIQIMFRSDQNIEDDMFADVFRAATNESKCEIAESMSENISETNECSENLERSSPKRLKAMEDKAVPDEAIVETIEDKVEDQSAARKISDAVVIPTENTTDRQLEESPIKETSSIENTINSPESIAEITNTEDNANISASIAESRNISPLPTNEEELLSLKTRLEDEQSELMTNIGKLKRQGIDISNQICIEAQELLRLFGIPYVVAPMEAESQCAYLEQINLTDGTITDDSDIWLFGGQCVYKNFFDNNKKVLQYLSHDIQHHFKLTRNEMIRLALLVGSDYTTGLTGIGPVTALEILAAFPSEGDDLLQGLIKFYSWIESGRSAGPGRTALRNKLQNLQIQKGFPSQAVVQAYLFPKVDESKEGFTWGKPNTILLANYTKQKFGWTTEKFNEIIKPVLKRLEEKQSQKSIHTYFKLQTVPKPIDVMLSKRVQKAVHRLNNPNTEEPLEDMESALQQIEKKKSIASSESRRKKRASGSMQDATDSSKPKISNLSASDEKNVEEYIPQREKDRAVALKKKLNAIEVLRKSKQGLNKTKKVRRCVRKVKQDAGLSESDSSS